MMNYHILFIKIIFAILNYSLFCQVIERGDPNFRRQTDIDVNKIRATIFNYGITGRSDVLPDQYPYEWPTNSGQNYIALTALAVGTEVITDDGEV